MLLLTWVPSQAASRSCGIVRCCAVAYGRSGVVQDARPARCLLLLLLLLLLPPPPQVPSTQTPCSGRMLVQATTEVVDAYVALLL